MDEQEFPSVGEMATPDNIVAVDPQRNQTPEHWWLAWAARGYLLWAGALCAGMEVSFWETEPLVPDDPVFARYTKQVGCRSDVLSIMRLHDASSRSQRPVIDEEGYGLVTVAVEAKASRADFKRGFDDTTADFNYLACPDGLVKPSELPKHVGLLVCAPGMVMRRRAKRIDDPRLNPDDAVWTIAASAARETRRTKPTIRNPFREEDGASE